MGSGGFSAENGGAPRLLRADVEDVGLVLWEGERHDLTEQGARTKDNHYHGSRWSDLFDFFLRYFMCLLLYVNVLFGDSLGSLIHHTRRQPVSGNATEGSRRPALLSCLRSKVSC